MRKFMALVAMSVGLNANANTIETAVSNYSSLVHKTYSESLSKAYELKKDIELFVAHPSVMTLEIAKESWKEARAPYGQSEVFRFYNGPIDSDEGPEGLLNAWPLDEVYIDYVVGNPSAGIVNNPAEYPVITKELLSSLNELDGEKNISTGYHAIEFLLWGQDLSVTGPGERPYTDYVVGKSLNAKRRGEYLLVSTELLVEHLESLVDAWAPNQNNFRKEFETKNPKEALKNILTGLIYMVGDELSGERMYVAWETMGQEDEHSCFSDMTHMDIQWNFWGIENVLRETGILNLNGINSTLADSITKQVSDVHVMLAEIPQPFDQAILDPSARKQILTSIEEMEAIAAQLVEVSEKLDAPVQW